MAHKDTHDTKKIELPNSVVGVMDVSRLAREMESLDDFMHQSSIREPGTTMSLPKMSKLLDAVATNNDLNLLKKEDRATLRQFLTSLRDSGPKLHISFSVDPSPLFLGKLTDYLRSTIHPYVLVQVGLQPNIGAGCVIRSTNQVFDLSLREDFRKKRGLLMKYVSSLKSNTEPQAETQPAPQQPEVQPQAQTTEAAQ